MAALQLSTCLPAATLSSTQLQQLSATLTSCRPAYSVQLMSIFCPPLLQRFEASYRPSVAPSVRLAMSVNALNSNNLRIRSLNDPLAPSPRSLRLQAAQISSQHRAKCNPRPDIKPEVDEYAESSPHFEMFSNGSTESSAGDNILHLHSTWIDTLLPESIRPYALLARLDKPIGIWLLWWPGMWSIALAAPAGSLPDFRLLALFGVGSVLIRGAACTINDIFDQDFDRKVERTKLRPIASGRVTTSQGLAFLALQILLSRGIILQLNDFSRILGAFNLIPLGIYPLMKRLTYWPQAFLGLTFNWGALLGWAAVHGSIDPYMVTPLYLSSFFWTLVHDTIYAHQDKEDDIKIGVKSTAVYLGDQTKPWLRGFGFLCVSLLCLAGYNNHLGWPFYVGLLATTGHLWWQIETVDLDDPVDCGSKFVSNIWYGAIVFITIASGKLVGGL